MPTYTESEVPTVISTGGNNGGMWGSDGIWAILLLALLGFGGRGFGGYGGGPGGSEFYGYQLGRTATSEDIASGFAQNTLQRGIDDIILGQSQMQNFINQGFAGLNSQLANCCCQTNRAIDGINYNMAKNTCDIIQANNANTQRILDFLTSEKICGLQAENSTLKGQLSQNAQTAAIVNALAPKAPVAAYTVPNPNCCYNSCGCGASIQ